MTIGNNLFDYGAAMIVVLVIAIVLVRFIGELAA